jgi:hypothetical protein
MTVVSKGKTHPFNEDSRRESFHGYPDVCFHNAHDGLESRRFVVYVNDTSSTEATWTVEELNAFRRAFVLSGDSERQIS